MIGTFVATNVLLMLVFYEIFILYRKIQKITENFSSMNYTDWIAGTIAEAPLKAHQGYWFVIDCTNEKQSNFMLDFLKAKGVRKDPDSSTGRYLYLHPKEES